MARLARLAASAVVVGCVHAWSTSWCTSWCSSSSAGSGWGRAAVLAEGTGSLDRPRPHPHALSVSWGALAPGVGCTSSWTHAGAHRLASRHPSSTSRGRISRGPLTMMAVWSGGRRAGRGEVAVHVERLSRNSRRISGQVVVNAPLENVWAVLTDYNALSVHVPNLVQSRLVPHPQGGIRLFQEGAAAVVGFDFKASLTMDMEEHYGEPTQRLSSRNIKFRLVDSGMFEDFSGEWRVQYMSRLVDRVAAARGHEDAVSYTTKIFYMVTVRPRGPVPVMALEWQTAQEVPNNLVAVKRAAETADAAFLASRRQDLASRDVSTGIYVHNTPVSAAKAAALMGWDVPAGSAGAADAGVSPTGAASAAAAMASRGVVRGTRIPSNSSGGAALRRPALGRDMRTGGATRSAASPSRVTAASDVAAGAVLGAYEATEAAPLVDAASTAADPPSPTVDGWEQDETLGAYVQKLATARRGRV